MIGEIARQTHVLALSAALEAARSGEAGRGLAILAAEMRGLAQRSSQAAKEINDSTTNSNGQVRAGVELLDKAARSLGDILESINAIAGLVTSTEQRTGIEELDKGLAHMDEVTPELVLVEET